MSEQNQYGGAYNTAHDTRWAIPKAPHDEYPRYTPPEPMARPADVARLEKLLEDEE